MTKSTTKSAKTNKGGNDMETMAQILRKLKAEFPEFTADELREMAREEYETKKVTEEAANTAETKKGKEQLELDDLDLGALQDFIVEESKHIMKYEAQTYAGLIMKFCKTYGVEVSKVESKLLARFDYLTTEKGKNEVMSLGGSIFKWFVVKAATTLVEDQFGDSIVTDLVDAGNDVINGGAAIGKVYGIWRNSSKYAEDNYKDIKSKLHKTAFEELLSKQNKKFGK